jgi:hypothetical protein
LLLRQLARTTGSGVSKALDQTPQMCVADGERREAPVAPMGCAVPSRSMIDAMSDRMPSPCKSTNSFNNTSKTQTLPVLQLLRFNTEHACLATKHNNMPPG